MALPTAVDEGGVFVSEPWAVLVDYEHSEALFAFLKKISSPFFKKDSLRLVEREETQSTSLLQPATMNSLLVFGHVGYSRRDVFLHLLRWMRLRCVQDVFSSVTVGCVLGDNVPHFFLEPLVACLHTESYRRWYRAHYAMACGVLEKILERRQLTRNRLEKIVQQSARLRFSANREELTKAAEKAFTEEFYRDHFQQLMNGGEDGEDSVKHYALLMQYDAATKEQRVDLARIAANVPTLFIAWSYRYEECITWMKEKLFNSEFLKELHAKTGLSDRFAAVFDADAWLKLVQEYIEVPPRRKVDKKKFIGVLVRHCKRAQIVLVNVDSDAAVARRVYASLLEECVSWRSPEVSLISLWAGKDALQSEFATMFNVTSFPFVFGSAPAKRDYKTGIVKPPVFVCMPPPHSIENVAEMSSPLPRRSREDLMKDMAEEQDAQYWHAVPREVRTRVCERVCAFISERSVPLFFSARVDKMYEIYNPYTDIPSKALRFQTTSDVTLRGLVSDRDIVHIAEEAVLLSKLRDFRLLGQLIQASAPIVIKLDPMTPRRYVLGLARVVTCSACSAIVDIDELPHFRCLQCTQEHGLLCSACAAEGTQHPPHHILVRIPPCITELSQTVLWGPSNIAAFALFCGKFITNTADVHLDVFCSRCQNMIKGYRWKCAVCYRHDLCHMCFRKATRKEFDVLRVRAEKTRQAESRRQGVTENTKHKGHQLWHPMLFIPRGRDGNNDEFLRPVIITSSLGDFVESKIAACSPVSQAK